VLYKFLTTPLQPEPQDLHDKSIRKLGEPKTVQQAFDLTKNYTPKQQYFSALSLFEQWNSNYAKQQTNFPNQSKLNSTKLKLELCIKKLEKLWKPYMKTLKIPRCTDSYKKL
jgi:phage/plasmid-associated DNA primase